MVRTVGVNPAPAAAPRLFPGTRERECVGVLPVKSLMREGGGERKREGHCQMQGGRREEDTHTHTRIGRLQSVCSAYNQTTHVIPAKNVPLCQQVLKSK